METIADTHHLSKLSLLTVHVESSGCSEPTQETTSSLIHYPVNASSISPNRSIEKGSCEDHQYCDFQAFRLSVTSPVLFCRRSSCLEHMLVCVCVHICACRPIKSNTSEVIINSRDNPSPLVRSSLGHQGHGTGRPEVLLLPSSMSGMMAR